MKQIIVTQNRRPESHCTCNIIFIAGLLLLLVVLREGAAEITAMAILLKELRRWRCQEHSR